MGNSNDLVGNNVNTENQYVAFQLGMETFGVEINKVKEIIGYRDTTQIPGGGELLEGIINLRGQIIPVFNLGKKFGFPDTERTGATRIVVVEANNNTVGIVVDGVSEVLALADDVIEKPSTMISSGMNIDFISGIAKMARKLVIVLDLEKVVSVNSGEKLEAV